MTRSAAGEPVRVLTVDDSAVVRGFLGRLIDQEPDMRVVATARDGQVALDVLDRREVDVVLLDVDMPVMDGLTALPLILRKAPSVKVIMASSHTRKGAEVTVRALSLGAADYVEKPSANGMEGLAPLTVELTRKIRVLTGRMDPYTGAVPYPALSEPVPGAAATRILSRGREPAAPHYQELGQPPMAMGIASSTGGPKALTDIMASLPREFPLPILITQHMPPLFTGMLAERLGAAAECPWHEGEDGMEVKSGHIYVAPGGRHMLVRREDGVEVIRLSDDPPENFCRPSADVLFRSMAETYHGAQLALVLTGMGHDGMSGAEAIARAGGTVIAQDEATSVVWGMPRAVVSAGIAHHVLPLDRIAGAVAARMGAHR